MEVSLIDTGPLSFDVKVNEQLKVTKSNKKSKARPFVNQAFKTDVFLVYKGKTKVGRIPDGVLSIEELGNINTCHVVSVNSETSEIVICVKSQ